MKTIPYRISSINVTSFSSANLDEIPKGIQIKTSFGFAVNRQAKRIKCSCEIVYEQENLAIMRICMDCEFAIDSTAFDSMLDDDHSILVEKYFLQYMASIVVGTIRGEIHARLEMEQNKLKSIVLPPLDLTQIFKEDLAMPLS